MATPVPTSGPFRPHARSLALAAGLALASVVPGCVTSPDEAGDLAGQRRKWASHNIRDYTVQSKLGCFCIPDATEPVTLTVRGGALTAVTRVSDGAPVDRSRWTGVYFTVDEMFALIADARSRGAFQVRVSYDPALGYPTQVYLDQAAGIADDERTLDLSGLTPIR